MHRGKKRVPTHRFPVESVPGAFGTGYAKDGEPVDVDERRMRGYPREMKAKAKPTAKPTYRRFSTPRVVRVFARIARVLRFDAPEAPCR